MTSSRRSKSSPDMLAALRLAMLGLPDSPLPGRGVFRTLSERCSGRFTSPVMVVELRRSPACTVVRDWFLKGDDMDREACKRSGFGGSAILTLEVVVLSDSVDNVFEDVDIATGECVYVK